MRIDGNPPRNSFVPVTVTVKDLNDNDPLFAQTRYTATLKEELPGGQGVVKVFSYCNVWYTWESETEKRWSCVTRVKGPGLVTVKERGY